MNFRVILPIQSVAFIRDFYFQNELYRRVENPHAEEEAQVETFSFVVSFAFPRSCSWVALYAWLHYPEGTFVVIVYRVVIHLAGNQHRTPSSTRLCASCICGKYRSDSFETRGTMEARSSTNVVSLFSLFRLFSSRRHYMRRIIGIICKSNCRLVQSSSYLTVKCLEEH